MGKALAASDGAAVLGLRTLSQEGMFLLGGSAAGAATGAALRDVVRWTYSVC